MDYIPKPFHPLEAIARVDNQLRLRAAERHLRDRNQQLRQFSNNLKELHRLSTSTYARKQQLFADYLESGCAMLGFKNGVISRITDGQYCIAAAHTDRDDLPVGMTAPLSNTYCSVVVAQQKTLACSQASRDPTLLQLAAYTVFGFESYLSTPIWLGGAIYGTLSFMSVEAREQDFNASEREIVELMAESLGSFLAAEQAEQQRQRAQRETELLLNVTQAIAAAPDFEQALQVAVSRVCEASGWGYGEVWLPTADQQRLQVNPAWYGRDQALPAIRQKMADFHAAGREQQFAAGEGLPGRVWQRGEPEYCADVAAERDILQRPLDSNFTPRASLAVPIVAPPINRDTVVQPGQVLAILLFCQFEAADQTGIDEDDERVVELIAAIATQLGTVLQHKRVEAELQALFAAMDDLVIVYDRHGRCLKFATHNPDLLVRSAGDKINQSLHDSLPADLADRHLTAINRALETQTTYSFDYQLELDGRMRWFSGKMSPLSPETVLFVTRDISQIQQAQAALRESEARFRAIFESTAIGIGLVNTQGDLLQANPALAAFLNYEPEMLCCLAFDDYTHPEDIAADRQLFERVVSGQLPSYQLEKRYLSTDGQVLWGRLTLCPVWQDGQLAFLVGMVEDINERKRAEQALRDSEAEMRAIFAAMTDLVLIRDRQGRCLKIAPTATNSLVRPPEEMVGRTLHDVLPLPLADRLLRYLQTVIDTQQSAQVEYSVPLAASECWLDACISPFGKDMAILVARDISERKLMEQKLRANEAELRSVFEAMDDIVLAIEPRQQHIQVMPTRRARADVTGTAAVDATCAQFFQATTREAFWQAVMTAIDSRETATLEYQLLIAGEPTWFNASISPLPNETALWVARDISGRVRAEQQLQLLASELEQRVIERTSQVRAANETLRAEISDRIRIQTELATSTEQLQAVLDAVPGFVSWLSFDPEGDRTPRYLGVNRLLAESFQRLPDDFIDRPLGFMSRGSEFTDFITEFFHSPVQAASTSTQLWITDSTRHYLVVAQKYDAQRAAVSVGIDITARVEVEQRLQRAYQRLQLLSELTLKIRQSLDLEEVLQTATQEVRHLLAADRVLIVVQTSASEGKIVQESVLPEWPSLHAQNVVLRRMAAEWQACQQGQPLAIADVTDTELDADQRHFLDTWQVQAELIVPIFVQAALWGKLTIHQCSAPRQWQSEEIELLQQFADQIGIALSQAQLLGNLEELVAARTTELQVANQHLQQEITERERVEAALRHSEEQLRRAVDSNTYGMVVYTPSGEVRFINRAAASILGGATDLVRTHLLDLPLQAAEAAEVAIARPSGNPGIVEVRTVAISWEGEAAILGLAHGHYRTEGG
ncbi:MAG: PAS domain S-box protein [Spirulinaceae cyanobacterium RM2_2_10]|nr:PAS domain S-box protein [Spirulinaceae cyanobacterium RM2_2_10]